MTAAASFKEGSSFILSNKINFLHIHKHLNKPEVALPHPSQKCNKMWEANLFYT